MVRQRFPKCECGHNFSDHQKHSGYFGFGGWCRKCANMKCEDRLAKYQNGCTSYHPLEW